MRGLFIASGLLFGAVVALLIVGVTSLQVGWMAFSLTCGMYLFIAVFTAAVVRFLATYTISPRESTHSNQATTPNTPGRIRRLDRPVPLS